jgi:Ca-activated chloride channel family protein
MKVAALFIFFINVLLVNNLSAQAYTFSNPKQYTRILFLLDGSQSMLNNWDRSTRMNEAKQVLMKLADSLVVLPNVEIGLRVYGHLFAQEQNNCRDTKLEVAFAKNNLKYVKKKLESIEPKGITPIALSLQKCAADFPKTNNSRNIVILITDGVESCNGDPCSIAKDLQAKGIILKPFVIGLGMGAEITNSLECIGHFENATDAASLTNILTNIIYNVLTKTTAQVSLLDEDKLPTETDVNISFYDADNGIVRYEMYHSLNGRGLPDTLFLDPIGKYNIDVHTTPRLEKYNIVLKKDEHSVIEFEAPQGYLKIACPTKSAVPCIIKLSNNPNTLLVQPVNTTKKFITGLYNIEVLTLPRIQFNNVKINQGKTTVFQIPPAGTVNITRGGDGYGGIFYLKDNEWIKLYSLKLKVFEEDINLQPGHYRVIYRDKQNKKMKQSVTKDFVIKSGQKVTITL